MIEFPGERILATDVGAAGQALQFVVFYRKWLAIRNVSPINFLYRLSGERNGESTRVELAQQIVDRVRSKPEFEGVSSWGFRLLKKQILKDRIPASELWSLVTARPGSANTTAE